jgi:putative spermidine/putrescine transport system permease protein
MAERPGFARIDLARLGYGLVIGSLAVLGLIVMVGPVVVGLVASFTSGATLRFPPPGLSTRWYEALLDPVRSGPIHVAAANSFEIAAWAVLGSILVAVPAAIGATRLSTRAATAFETVVLLPLVLPSLVYGLAALMGATMVGLRPSMPLVVLGHIVVFGPLVYRATVAVAGGLDPRLEEASAGLGAAPWRTFVRILLPLLAPGIAAGAFLVLMTSLDNVSITLFLADPGTSVLPLRLWQMIEQSLDPRVAAVAGVLIAGTFVLLLAAWWLGIAPGASAARSRSSDR